MKKFLRKLGYLLTFGTTKKQVEKAFPITVNLTQEIIDEGRKAVWDSDNCVGARLLKAAIADKDFVGVKAEWGFRNGSLHTYHGNVEVGTEQDDDMTQVLKPGTYTLILK